MWETIPQKLIFSHKLFHIFIAMVGVNAMQQMAPKHSTGKISVHLMACKIDT